MGRRSHRPVAQASGEMGSIRRDTGGGLGAAALAGRQAGGEQEASRPGARDVRAVKLQHKLIRGFKNNDAVRVAEGNCSATFWCRAIPTGRMRDVIAV
jgi:hypothetical protein